MRIRVRVEVPAALARDAVRGPYPDGATHLSPISMARPISRLSPVRLGGRERG